MDELFLDACVALNLLASGIDLGEVAAASSVRFHMTTVVASEMLWLDPLDPPGAREHFDAGALAARGIVLVGLRDEELETFVELARTIDDGEASTIAVAINRKVRIATDDRKALRLAASQSPVVQAIGTTDLLRRWAESTGADRAQLNRIVRFVQVRASFVPPRGDPHLVWWTEATKA